ncbi:MAG: diaminopimelate decarboxylase [Alphaproteobacteria bacterium]
MNPAFSYRGGVLHVESVPVTRLAEAWPTPFYCYSRGGLRTSYQALAGALQGVASRICFAVKANGNLSVIRAFAELGAGADVVSVGEMRRALAGGVAADKIIFSGVGKTRDEISTAAAAGIYQFNVESIPELEVIDAVGRAAGRRLAVALRVNPDVDPRTHAKISTGQKETKFGIEAEQTNTALEVIRRLPHVDLCSIAVHIGSQLMELEPFDEAFGVVAALVREWRAVGHDIRRVDLGGGLGIRYTGGEAADLAGYAALVRRHFGALNLEIALEPGRFLVGEAGILVSRVIYAKRGLGKNFLIIDAAMNDLVRPAMYDAYHNILPIRQGEAVTSWDIVGPICETSDLFGQARSMPDLAPGDVVAVMDAGAYGASMSSTYNARDLIAEIMVDADRFALIRRAVKIDEQLSWDVPPVWAR